MNLVVCPTLLFIEEFNWKNEETRTYFETTLIELLDFISNNRTKIYWNDTLEILLWSNPHLYPWFDANNYGISERLHQNILNIPESILFQPCSCIPKIKTEITTIDTISPTLSLIHYLNVNKIDFDFCVDKDNCKDFLFVCECHKIKSTPCVISSFKCTVNLSEEINKIWDYLDINDNFKKIILLVIDKYFNNVTPLYDIDFENSFIEKVKTQKRYRGQIVYSISNRLVKFQKHATQDKSLKDEPVKGSKSNKRRFRVKEAKGRIHYVYQGKAIKFTDYYTDGEHDDGL